MKLGGLPLILLTILFIGIFTSTIINLQLIDIRANWTKRRCESMVIAIAHMVPDGKDSSVDPTQFAIDNFYFCMNKLADISLTSTLAPVLDIFKVQLDATNPISESMNYLRSNAKSLLTPVNDFFQIMWDHMKILIAKISHVFYHTHNAFKRMQALVLSSIFAGTSVIQGLVNLINLVLRIIREIIAMIMMMMILCILLSLFIPGALSGIGLLITLVSAIAIIVEGSTVISELESVSGAIGFTNLCVGKGTLVAVEDGWKAVEELKPGDTLRNGITVEGVLKVSGKGGKCVLLEGVVISDVHVVMDTADGMWKHAGKHPLAQITGEEEFLYCLNTSDHTWTVKGDAELLLRDWHEMPATPGLDVQWEKSVFSALNPSLPPCSTAPGRGLFGKWTMVWEKTKGAIHISEVAIGDFVKDGNNSFTEVLGVYKDCVTPVPPSSGNESVWIFKDSWEHVMPTAALVSLQGYQLITASGMFLTAGKFPILVRDFTEVGVNNELNTEYAVKFLNTL